MTADARRSIETVWRIESARLIAGLTRVVHDVGLAEDLAQDALVAALERWPQSGVPDNPGAWLMATAKNRAIDGFRRAATLDRKQQEMAREQALSGPGGIEELDAVVEERVEDDLLRLMFLTCHPLLPTQSRVALTLRLVGGLTTPEIARAFLVSEPTVAQRIVRAKKALTAARAELESPSAAERVERVSSVLDVVYLVFNEGYSATAGDDWVRPALCEDALRLGRILATLSPHDAEVHGLLALMEIQASRTAARIGPAGEPVLLLEQNRARWDHVLIARGLAALDRSLALEPEPGTYAMQAAIAACHARARSPEQTDWARIAELYGVLSRRAPSPVVELNRAVAVGMAAGPGAGLALVEPLLAEPALKDYHLLPAVRADFLVRLGRFTEARADLERAAALTDNGRERRLLLDRAADCAAQAQG